MARDPQAHDRQLRAARGVRPGARRRGPSVDGSEPGVEGCEVGAQEQLASWEAVVNEKHKAALRGVRRSYKQSVFSLEPNGGDVWQGAAADTTEWKCQGVCVPRPVPSQGAVSLRCVKCHCGETGFVGMPGQNAGDLRCVKCHLKKFLHCRRLTRSIPRQGAVSLRCVKCHCGETGFLRVPSQSAGDLRCVKCHRRKSLHCLRLTRSVPRQGASLRCVKCHCGETGSLGMPWQSAGDLRCVKCHRRKSLHCPLLTRSVPRQGAVSLRRVKCHCGKTASYTQLIMSGKGIARQWAKAAAKRAAKEKLSVKPGVRDAQARIERSAAEILQDLELLSMSDTWAPQE
jgi:hypothetical protein